MNQILTHNRVKSPQGFSPDASHRYFTSDAYTAEIQHHPIHASAAGFLPPTAETGIRVATLIESNSSLHL